MNLKNFFKNLFRATSKPRPLTGLYGVERVDVLLNNLVVEHRVPGMAATIVQNGALLLQKGYGYADFENKIPVDPKKTVFRTASISKCITGLALGKMIEEGILNWDDSLYDFVPEYPKKGHDFSLRQLATHTAGIRGYQGKEYALNKPYSIEESLEIFKDDPLVFKPGNGYLYNSFDFVLLSVAMQKASGIPFQDYVMQKVLLPLGMSKTYAPDYHSDHNLKTHSAKFYTKTASSFKKAIEVNNFYKLAGGGYLSTSEDIAKLGTAIAERKLLNSKTYEELLTAQLVNGRSTYYGLGFQVSQDTRGQRFVGHVGNSIGTYTNFFVYPKRQFVISILINCTDPKVQPYLDEVVACFDPAV